MDPDSGCIWVIIVIICLSAHCDMLDKHDKRLDKQQEQINLIIDAMEIHSK